MPAKRAGISSEAVEKKTGKTWEEWMRILDKAGARKWEHKAIATWLYETQGVPGWWAQMVTVGYEQAHGLREAYQKADGYSASVSRTMNVPLASLYGAFADAKARRRWLGAGPKFEVRRATEGKSMRVTFTPEKGVAQSLEINFYAKGDAKAQVALQANKLPEARLVQAAKEFWSAAFERLKAQLGG